MADLLNILEKTMKKLKLCLILFLNMLKIGLITFGGGYAMIAILQREFVEKKKWLEMEEFADIISIAESTPGPIAINSSTYIGYKLAGVLGSIFATIGVVLPSFVIIFCISLFFDAFLGLTYVKYAFMGIQACVAYLILSAGIKMLKTLKTTPIGIILTIISTGCLVSFTLFAISFSTVFYILIGGAIGLVIYLLLYIKSKKHTPSLNSKNHENLSNEIPEDKSEENVKEEDK